MGGFEEDEDLKPKVLEKHETIQELIEIMFVDGVGGEVCVANIFTILDKEDDIVTKRQDKTSSSRVLFRYTKQKFTQRDYELIIKGA